MKLKIEEITRSISAEEVEEIVSEVIDRSYTLDDKDQQSDIIKALVNKLDNVLDFNSKKNVMQEQGKFCFHQGTNDLVKEIVGKSNSFDEYIENLNKNKVAGTLKRDGDKVHIYVDECPCPVIKDADETISKTFCMCSSGWYKELFETYLGEDTIELEIVSTIASGSDKCHHIAHINK